MCQQRQHAFTLVELLVSAVVVLILLGIILLITGNVGATISRATARLDAFAAGRSAFDLVTRRLAQATLNPYYGYLDAQGRAMSDPYYANGAPVPFAPVRYGRQSDLQFLVRQNLSNPGCGQEVYFVAPLTSAATTEASATTGLLNAGGFFVRYGSNEEYRPATVNSPRARYRLMQAVQPTERLTVFSSVAAGDLLWLAEIENTSANKLRRYVTPLVENVLVFTVWPRLAEQADAAGNRLTVDYAYDSHPAPVADPTGQPDTANQLPPALQVTMVVLNEASVTRLQSIPGAPPAALSSALLNAESRPKFRISNTSQHQVDLNDLSARLTKQGITFEIFTTTILMREARWGIRPQP